MHELEPRRARASRTTATLAALLVCACAGEGSDIGPRLPRIPDESCKVYVFDGQGRGVVSATVTVVGGPVARTGRNGRGDFLATPRGRVLLDVDGSAGAAAAGDQLASLRVATTIVGPDVDVPVYLPELSDDAATVPVGLQASATTLTTAGGAVVSIAPATSIGIDGGAANVTLRVGELPMGRLPGDLPSGGLVGRGVFLDPPGASFVPGIDLSVPDDLQLGTAVATLFHLDPETGEWTQVAVGSPGSTAVIGALTEGGLYAWGLTTTLANVTGRVVDASSTPLAIPDAIVRVDGRQARTAADGTFVVDSVPTRVGDGTPRNTSLEVLAGGSWLPARATATVTYDPITAGFVAVGDVVLDTLPAGTLRVQQVVRARADGPEPCRLSPVEGDVAFLTMSDANGQAIFEDVPAGFFGYQEGRRRSNIDVYYGQALGFLAGGRRWLDSYQFLFDRAWFQGTRSARAYVCDAIGGGPVRDAVVVQGEVATEGFVGETRENGLLFADRGFLRRATAVHLSERDGSTIRHAFSYQLPSADHLEFPLQRVLREPLGAFDRHGVVAGDLTGVTGGREHGLRVTRRITAQQWWDDVVDGRPLQSALPIDVDPATTHGAYRAGIAVAGGNLAAIEYTTPAAGNRLAALGFLAGYEPTEGAVEDVDVPLDHVATAAFALPGALTGAPAEVDANALDLALALELADGTFVDVARDLDGSIAASATDLTLTLPPLTGALDGARWRAVLQGSASSGGVTSSHASLVSLAAANTPGFSFPQFPTLSSPAPGATVDASGLVEVGFALPAGALGGMLELRADSGTELLLWQVLVRPDEPNFTFVPLPVEADEETPLLAGRTYTLTITAWFGAVDIASPDVFGDFVSFAQSIALIEAGVTQVTRRSIQITTN